MGRHDHQQPPYRPTPKSARELAPLKPPDPGRPCSITIISNEESVEITLLDPATRKVIGTVRLTPAAMIAALARYGRQPAEWVPPVPPELPPYYENTEGRV